MNVLAIESSLGPVSVAVRRPSGEILAPLDPELRSERLITAIGEVLISASLRWTDMDRIAVTLGPGSFTGVRVGISAARALSLTTGIEAVGTGTLELMAYLMRLEATEQSAEIRRRFAVCMAAGRERAYVQLFDASGASLGSASIWDGANLPHAPSQSSWIVAGSAASMFADWATRRGDRIASISADLKPSAAALAALAPDLKAGSILPLYLREPDANPQIGKAVLRTASDPCT